MRVNDTAAGIGRTVGAGDRISLDGRDWQVVARQAEHHTLIYNKPEGVVTTRSDEKGRPTVFDKLPRLKHQRWIAVGRLDLNTTGLLILTTDGELANTLMHPASNVDREYVCRVRGVLDEDQLRQLQKGVRLDDGMARFTDIVPGEVTTSHAWYTVALTEGRNREVRRLWEAVGCQVARLKRVRFGPVFLPATVKVGRYKEMTAEDHRVLREDVGLTGAATELVLEPVR